MKTTFLTHDKFRVMNTYARALRLPVLCLFLIGFFITNEGIAQSSETTKLKSPLMEVPKGPFVGSDLATIRIDEQLGVLKNQLETLTPGSQSYNLINWKYVYFQAVRDRISEGREVEQSIVAGLGVYFTDMYGDAPESQRLQNKNSMVELLRI